MGEQSYFRRKFFHSSNDTDKPKRLKKQGRSRSSSRSSKDSASAECAGQVAEFPAEFATDCDSSRRANDRSGPAESGSAPGEEPDFDRQPARKKVQEHAEQDERRDKARDEPQEGPRDETRAGGQDAAADCSGGGAAHLPDQPADDSSQRQPSVRPAAAADDGADHIETIAFHPEPGRAAAGARSFGGEPSKQESKLRKATRAILSLRRATCSLASHPGDQPPPSVRAASKRGFSYPRSLVATFWRQNTADNSTCTRSARVDSFNGSGGWSQTALAAAASQQDIAQSAGGRQRRLEVDQQSSASSSTFRLSQFIVPRVNALKLPIVCLIKSLDGELMREVFVHRYELGQYLIDSLKVSLGLRDAKYFGLKLAKSSDEQEDVRQPWLDLTESVYKQISKHCKSVLLNNLESGGGQPDTAAAKSVDFYLRVKFYPPNLARVQDQFLRQYLWLQLRRDLRLGKLISSMNNLALLMACVFQFELHDYKPELADARLAQMNLLPNQDLLEQQAVEIWRTRLVGAREHQAQMRFLRASVILETYGFDYYPVRDHQRQRAYLLGFNYAGVKTIRNGRIVHHFRWHNLSKISYERRMIIFHIYPSENSKRKQILGFKCLSNEDCANLYMRLLEQKYFFTVDLTYFDKSMRRPSHLAESALEREQLAGDWPQPADEQQQQQQQQLEEEQEEEEEAPTLSDDGPEPDEFDGSSEPRPREQERDQQQQRQQLRQRRQWRQERTDFELDGTARRHSNRSPVAALDGDIPPANPSGRPPFEGCDCASCERDLQMHRQRPHSSEQSLESRSCSSRAASLAGAPPSSAAHLIKSCSVQEAAGRRSPSERCAPLGPAALNCTSPPDWLSAGCNSATTQTAAAAARLGGQNGLPLPRLQRQCSVLKYSPDFEMINEATREQERQSVSPSREPARGPARGDFGQRVAGLAEQVLAQPARLFTCPDGPAASLEGAGVRAPHMDSSLFVQGLLFCLLVLALDLALRLSDGLSSALQELLAFRRHSATANSLGLQSANCVAGLQVDGQRH